MRTLLLRIEHTNSLLTQPESGMGFQIVEAEKVYPPRPEVWLVFNSDLAIVFENEDEAQGWARSHPCESETTLRARAQDAGDLYSSLHVVTTRADFGLPARSYGPTRMIAPAALSLVKKTQVVAGATYYRFSAFPNDRRVNQQTGDFLPGTYATTATDKPMAPSGFAAIGRYALPNILPASFIFTLSAVEGANIHIGTVAPAYGQSGGGVEVFFPNGSSSNIGFQVPARLPDE